MKVFDEAAENELHAMIEKFAAENSDESYEADGDWVVNEENLGGLASQVCEYWVGYTDRQELVAFLSDAFRDWLVTADEPMIRSAVTKVMACTMDSFILPFEKEWIAEADPGVDLSSLPASLLRSIYGDLLQCGPNHKQMVNFINWFSSGVVNDDMMAGLQQEFLADAFYPTWLKGSRQINGFKFRKSISFTERTRLQRIVSQLTQMRKNHQKAILWEPMSFNSQEFLTYGFYALAGPGVFPAGSIFEEARVLSEPFFLRVMTRVVES